MILKEYRICMPLSVQEYHVGQLYMIAKHSSEESKHGEGVEVVENCPIDDPDHGTGQFTEKRIHLSNRLPSWIRSLVPKIFYITEKAWNYYPFTITEYTCSFVPRFAIHIQTKYLNDKGTTDNCLDLSNEMKESRVVEFVDIVNDKVADHHYKESEDLSQFTSSVTGRGPLPTDWLENADPVMCSYKSVEVKLDLWAFQTRIEEFIHKSIREILLVGHRQAVAWIDDWYGMSIEDVRDYEQKMQQETNERLLQEMETQDDVTDSATTPATTPTSATSKKGWFNWS